MAVSPFDHLRIAGHVLPSRVLLAPINTGFAYHGRPTEQLLRFHRQRSGTAIGISMVGNVALSDKSAPNTSTLVLASASDLPRYKALARAISSAGSLAGIQLGYSPAGLAPVANWVTRDRAREKARLASLISSLSDASIDTVLRSFATGVSLAVRARFDVVQIHAAHGYLVSLLLNPFTNSRTGPYRLSGPWLVEFAERVLECALPRLVSVRLSIFSGLKDDISEEVSSIEHISRLLARAGIHILDYSAGFYTVDKRLIYPGIERGVAPYYPIARDIAQRVPSLVSFAGNITDIRTIPPLAENMLVSVGRAFIADPGFALKARSGLFDDITRCRRTGRCHFFSRGKQMIECGVNPLVSGGITHA